MSDLSVLQGLQLDNGLFLAAPNGGYEKVWIRDNVYVAEGYEALGDWNTVRRIYWGLLNILHRHNWKIDWALWQRPRWHYEYIHPRYDNSGNEIHEPWGFKQNDAIGILLYKIAHLEKAGVGVLRSHADQHLLQKLVWYLNRVEYWEDADSGMWEENEERHASSIGACLRALQELHGLVHIPEGMIERGWEALHRLLPRESESKTCDLAQLSLVYPLNMAEPELVEQVENELLRTHGVVRYANDAYHRNGSEAEWTMGIPWLGLCWLRLGDRSKARRYLAMTERVYWGDQLPECYSGHGPCEHSPLAWSHSLTLSLRALLDKA
jgi:GH15 family glucan-1,4-alpha-glucosidase